MTTSSTVEYRVRVLPSRHELQVEMTLSGPVATGSVHLQIPTWVPGDYSFAPQARDLFNVLARGAITNKALPIRRDGWQSYVVEEGAGQVQVSYTASAWGDDYGVLDDSSAGAAGLAPGDTIGAINNYAFSVAALTWVGGRAEPVTLGVRRGHRDLSFTLTPAPRERIQSIRWNGTAAQSEHIGKWLHQNEIDLASGKEVDLGFYENFHGVEIVV